jgi:uncharacterized protein YndB with AHSA1/START domain
LVPLTTAAAFDLFVRRLDEWWPLAARSVFLDNAASCHVEPHIGGRLYERSRDGREETWGRFIAFEDGRRVVFTWHPGLSHTSATEVEITFFPLGSDTRVDVEHRRWERLGPRASFVRAIMDGGWPGVLARFEACARGTVDLPTVEGPGCMPDGATG